MAKGKKEKSWKIGFLKKLGAGILGSLTFLGLNERVNAAINRSPEATFYNYLDKGKYQYIDEGRYRGRYNYVDRGMYGAADKKRFHFLDNWRYKHDDFYFQEIYKDFFKTMNAHPYSPNPLNTKIFRMPQTNPIAQSDYFRDLYGYENPFNISLNFYLARKYFRDYDDTLINELQPSIGVYDYERYYGKNFPSVHPENYKHCERNHINLERGYSNSILRDYINTPALKPSSVVLPFSAVSIDPIPEPATIALLGLGGLALLKGEQKGKLKRKNKNFLNKVLIFN